VGNGGIRTHVTTIVAFPVCTESWIRTNLRADMSHP
jgi:hypothetical protein